MALFLGHEVLCLWKRLIFETNYWLPFNCSYFFYSLSNIVLRWENIEVSEKDMCLVIGRVYLEKEHVFLVSPVFRLLAYLALSLLLIINSVRLIYSFYILRYYSFHNLSSPCVYMCKGGNVIEVEIY